MDEKSRVLNHQPQWEGALYKSCGLDENGGKKLTEQKMLQEREKFIDDIVNRVVERLADNGSDAGDSEPDSGSDDMQGGDE